MIVVGTTLPGALGMSCARPCYVPPHTAATVVTAPRRPTRDPVGHGILGTMKCPSLRGRWIRSQTVVPVQRAGGIVSFRFTDATAPIKVPFPPRRITGPHLDRLSTLIPNRASRGGGRRLRIDARQTGYMRTDGMTGALRFFVCTLLERSSLFLMHCRSRGGLGLPRRVYGVEYELLYLYRILSV